MTPEEIQVGDQMVQEHTGIVFWTAVADAEPPIAGEVYVKVRYRDGGCGERFLPAGRPLPIRRPPDLV